MNHSVFIRRQKQQPVRRTIFNDKSGDQSWGWKTPVHGTYPDCYTWFDATKRTDLLGTMQPYQHLDGI